MKKINCLVFAIGSTHIISSLCAILTRHSPESVNVVILAQWPAMEDELTNELSVVMQSMVRVFPFVEAVRIIPYSTFSKILTGSDRATFEIWIKERTGVDHAEEIYYPHDMVGQFYQALATIYSNARRICVGEDLGSVVERKAYLSQFFDEPQLQAAHNADKKKLISLVTGLRARLWIRTRLGKLLRKITSFRLKPNIAPLTGITFKDFLPDEAVLILPLDAVGNLLKRVPFSVCSKKIVLDVLGKCTESCSELQIYIRSLLNKFKGKRKYLLLTEYMAEANFMDFERETEMYCQMVFDHCEPGSVVFIKSHPGETLPRGERIAERLAGKYEVIALDKKFKRYAIELWNGLVLESTVIAMSYPVLSLKYLHDVDAINPLSADLIENWFPQRSWAVIKYACTISMESLKRLPEWDGKSVLWTSQLNKPSQSN